MWDRIKRSLTMAWAAVVAAASVAFATVMSLADVLNMPEIKAQVAAVFAAYPQAVGAIGLAVAVITALARLHSLAKG